MNQLLLEIFSKQASAALFKAGIVLFSVSLLTISDIGQFLYEKELDAYASKFEVEALSGLPLNQTKCAELKPKEHLCNYARYKVDLVNSSVELAQYVSILTLRIGTALFFVSGLLFVFSPLAHRQLSSGNDS